MQTAACRAAVEDLVLLLGKPDPDPNRLEQAIAHVEGCPYCTSRIGYLLQALGTSYQEDILTCQECRELLPDYLQAEEEEEEEPWQRQVAVHLSTCPSCAAAYGALAELAALADGEEGIEPPTYPVPDLSFLEAKKASPPGQAGVRWWLDEMGRLIVQLSDELIQAMRPPGLRAATAGLKAGPSRGELFELVIGKAGGDLSVTITAEEEPGDPDRCALVVSVDVPSRGGWPNLAGSRVVLRRQEQELERQRTDAFGQVVFEEVEVRDLGRLAFEIAPVAADDG